MDGETFVIDNVVDNQIDIGQFDRLETAAKLVK